MIELKTGRPRAICGQGYPLPCFAWLWIGVRESRAAAPKGTKSYRTQGDSRLSIRSRPEMAYMGRMETWEQILGLRKQICNLKEQKTPLCSTEENQLPKGNIWSAIPIALLCMIVNLGKGEQGSGSEGDSTVKHRGTFILQIRHFHWATQKLWMCIFIDNLQGNLMGMIFTV